jgi:hypothetical protein
VEQYLTEQHGPERAVEDPEDGHFDIRESIYMHDGNIHTHTPTQPWKK